MVMQQEHGKKKGGHHIQGYIHYSTQKYASQCGTQWKLIAPCFRKPDGKAIDQQAYCTEPDKRVPGTEPWIYGECPQGQGERSDLKRAWSVVKENEDLDAALFHEDTELATLKFHKHLEWGLGRIKSRKLKNATRTVFVMVYEGTPGAGKSEQACLFDPDQCFTMPPPKSQTDLWFGDYNGERTLIIDEFDKQPKATLSLYWIKKILDGRPLQVPIKNGHRWAEWEYVVVTTNHHPTVWYPDADDFWQEQYTDPKSGITSNFGAEYPSALQRRIDWVYTFTGVWPNTNYAPHYPLTLSQLLVPPTEEGPAEVAGEPPAQGATTPLSATVAPSPQETQNFLEQLKEDWEAQDNDYMPASFEPMHSADPDGIFEGTDGDKEPLKGINLDPSKDVY